MVNTRKRPVLVTMDPETRKRRERMLAMAMRLRMEEAWRSEQVVNPRGKAKFKTTDYVGVYNPKHYGE